MSMKTHRSRPRPLWGTLPAPSRSGQGKDLRGAVESASERSPARLVVRCASCGRELDRHEIHGEAVALCYRCK